MIDGVTAELRPAEALKPDTPAPFYLAADHRLVRPVRKGDALVGGDLDLERDSSLLTLRRQQDAMFFDTSGQRIHATIGR